MTAQKPVILLSQPQMGENIGAAARAMRNFGLEEMRIIAPRDGWPNPRAVAMASGAGRILDQARVFDTLEEAAADLHALYATTARPREMTKPVYTPEAAIDRASGELAQGLKIGLLFGREKTGLENDEVARASAVVTVPTNPEFSSLNLAQCVLLMSYEWGKRAYEAPPEALQSGKAFPAPMQDIARFSQFFEESLDEAGFFRPAEKKPHMVTNLRALLHRAGFTDQDLRTLWGAVKALKNN